MAIPVAAVVSDAGSESIAVEDDTINGMMPTMMWEDDSTVGDGGDVDDDACSTDFFFRIFGSRRAICHHERECSLSQLVRFPPAI